jgi:uracil-DNA glycosylase
MNSHSIRLSPSWLAQLESEFEQDYMLQLRDFLLARKKQQAIIYPAGNDIFNAMNSVDFDKVKVVMLGQDPYHGPGQAHGLCFSVPKGVKPPPSLVNIFKELNSDVGIPSPQHGCLQSWTERGVLLLNAVLTVEQQAAGAHAGKGWEQFTDSVIAALNKQREGIVFMLWGSYAQKKGQLIDSDRHCVLKSPHPSPLSAHRGFLGNRHFSQANQYLQSRGLDPIDWSLD